MPRRKIQLTLEEEEEFHRRRREKKAEHQRRYHQNAKIANNFPTTSCGRNDVVDKTIHNNHIIEHQFIHTSGTISNNRVIELDDEIIGESITNTTPIHQQSHTIYQSHYRSRRRQLHRLNINRMLIDNINEYYIGSMDVSCIHCNQNILKLKKYQIREIHFMIVVIMERYI